MPVTELLLPRTSDAMTEAVVAKWLVANETEVHRGDLVAEVETDKALVEVSAEGDGLLVTAVAEGATVEVGSVLAYLVDGDDVAEYREGRISLGSPPPDAIDSIPAPSTPDQLGDTQTAPVGDGEQIAGGELQPRGGAQPVFSSPLARRLAREKGLRIEDLYPGSGPNGRVVREDVLRHSSGAPPSLEAPTSTRHRSMVAAMVSSKAEIPHFYLFKDVDLGAVLHFREALAAAELPTPSVSAILIKALGHVLAENEFSRRRYIDGQVQATDATGVGIAVADGVDEIVVPVIQNPAVHSLEHIALELVRVSDAVRAHALRREDMVGSVATISNLGMYGIDALLPIIPPFQSFILGIGRGRQEVVLDEAGRASSRSVSTFSLAGDHRVLTGLGGARILERLDHLLQHPLLLTMDGRAISTT